MKTKSQLLQSAHELVFKLGIAAAVLVACLPSAHAATYYWDTNGATPGAGNATGTWGTNTFWTTDSTGSSATTAYAGDNSSDVVFSAGSAGTLTTNPGITGTQNASSVTFQNGAALNIGSVSGVLNIGGTGANSGIYASDNFTHIVVGNITLNADIAIQNAAVGQTLWIGSGSSTLTGSRNITINANNTGSINFNGGLVNNAGTITSSGTGTGGITIKSVGSNVTGITNSGNSGMTLTNLAVNSGTTTLTADTRGIFLTNAATGTGNVNVVQNSSVANSIQGGFNNSGTVTFSGNGSATGMVTSSIGSNVTGVTLDTTGSNNSTWTVTGLTVNSGGTTLTNQTNVRTLTITNQVTGTGDLVLNYAGSSYSNPGTPFQFADGINNAGTITASGNGTTGLTINSVGSNVTGIINNGNGIVWLPNLAVNNDTTTLTANTKNIIISGTASGTGNVTKSGTAKVEFRAANTYTGMTTVNAGTLELNHVNALQNSTLNTGTSGSQIVTFTVNGTNTYNLGGLQGADNLAIGNNTVSVGANNGNTTFSGSITGPGGGLTKAGTGTLTLSGTNTYTGTTTVSTGTLLINGSTAAASAVSVDDGAIIGGSGTIGGNLTLASGALFAFDTANTLTLGGNSTFALNSSFGVASLRNLSGTALQWDSIAEGTYTLITGGNLVPNFFNASNISNFGFGNALTGLGTGGAKAAYFDNGSLQLVVIPEPTTWALLAASLTTLVVFRRRRQH